MVPSCNCLACLPMCWRLKSIRKKCRHHTKNCVKWPQSWGETSSEFPIKYRRQWFYGMCKRKTTPQIHDYNLRRRGRVQARARWMRIFDYLEFPVVERKSVYMKLAREAEKAQNYLHYCQLKHIRYFKKAHLSVNNVACMFDLQ